MSGAFFGPASDRPQPRGAFVSVHLVPVFEGRLVAFDVAAKEARGRWLPWDVLPFAENPYAFASGLADEWCDGALSSLQLVDVLSFPALEGGWELAIVFRAELTALPPAERERAPFVYAPGAFDAIGNFDPVDLERWVATNPSAPATPRATGGGLVF